MLGSLKRLFGKDQPSHPPAPPSSGVSLGDRAAGLPAAPQADLASAPAAPAIQVPLAVWIKSWPEDLRKQVLHEPKKSVLVGLPLSGILAQLPRGTVKFPLADVRQWAPPGTFGPGDNAGSPDVIVPLNLVLGQLDPKHFARRAGQQTIALSDKIGAVFSARGGILAQAQAPLESGPIPAPAPPPPRPEETVPATPESVPTTEAAVELSSAEAEALPPPAARAPEIPAPISMQEVAMPTEAMPVEPEPVELPPPVPASLEPIPAESLPQEPAETAEDQGDVLRVSLSRLMGDWPEPIRQALAAGMAQAALALPLAEVEEGLKHGKLVFPWKQLRGWVRPRPADHAMPGQEECLLALPLNEIVPLFVPRRRASATQKKITLTTEIPDVFVVAQPTANEQSIPVAEPVVAPPPAPPPPVAPPQVALPPPLAVESAPEIVPQTAPRMAEAPVPVAPPAAPEVSPVPAAPLPTAPAAPIAPPVSTGPPAELDVVFGQPGKTIWTPVELAQTTCTLDGVAGTIIALSDGFLVADQLPPELNAEVIAAFLPQIFGRMSHYTNELKLGETRMVSLRVQDCSLQIWRAGTLFLLALSKPGQALPESALQSVAAYLSRQL